MLTSAVLSIREGLEAALLIGIVLGALYKIGRPDLRPAVWAGVASAAAASLLAGLAMTLLGQELEGPAEPIFEGLIMLLAAGLLTWVIFWMARHARQQQVTLENNIRKAALQAGRGALFGLAFVAVIREGVELSLYLFVNGFQAGGFPTLIGAAAGLLVAVGLAWLFFRSTRRLNLRRFFQLTNILLVLFAAGLVAHGARELVEAGWLPPLLSRLWDASHLLSAKSLLGQAAGGLFGYTPQPSLMETLAYLGYFLILAAMQRIQVNRTGRNPETVQTDA